MRNKTQWRHWLPLLTLSLLTTAYGAQTHPNTPPGSVLSVDKSGRGFPLAQAGENYFITYTSVSASGQLVPVTGQMALPRTPPPAGGYPVLSWASGTTGMGPQCAPSNAAGHAASLNEWVKRGYAVLRTDYEGWGDSGPRPLLNQRSNTAAVVNLVKAAHSVSDRLAADWMVAGHSEGGGTALWTAASDEAVNGPFKLKAAIALAPVGPGIRDMVHALANRLPTTRDFPLMPEAVAASLTAATILGARATDASIRLDDLVAQPFRPWVDASAQACVNDPLSLPLPALGQYLKPGASYERLEAFLNQQDPSSQSLRVPVWIAQAGQDQLTPTPPTTARMVKDLCARGGNVSMTTYAEPNHGQVVQASLQDALAYAKAALTGTALPASACSPSKS